MLSQVMHLCSPCSDDEASDQLVGTGSCSSPLDAEQRLSVGATTVYQKYTTKDPALQRGLQLVVVSELTVDETIGILKGLIMIDSVQCSKESRLVRWEVYAW